MISLLFGELTQVLKNIKDCSVFTDKVPQETEAPYFYIQEQDFKYLPALNHVRKAVCHLKILYYPGDALHPEEECRQIQQELAHCLDAAGSFVLKKRKFSITQEHLKMSAEVIYREMKEEENPVMQTETQNLNLKEE